MNESPFLADKEMQRKTIKKLDLTNYKVYTRKNYGAILVALSHLTASDRLSIAEFVLLFAVNERTIAALQP